MVTDNSMMIDLKTIDRSSIQ